MGHAGSRAQQHHWRVGHGPRGPGSIVPVRRPQFLDRRTV